MKIIGLMLENIKMMKNMGKVFIRGPTENAMTAVGKTASNMEMPNSQIPRVNNEKVSGRMVLA